MNRIAICATGLAAALAGIAAGDVVLTFDTGYLQAGEGILIDLGHELAGSLTGLAVDFDFVNLQGSGIGLAAPQDLLIGVQANTTLVQMGGWNIDLPGVTYDWASWPGLTFLDGFYSFTKLAPPGNRVTMSGHGFVHVVNGYDKSTGASYSGTITLHGVNLVPAPGPLALLAGACLTLRGRRR